MKTLRKITSKAIGLTSTPGEGFKLMGKLRIITPGQTDKGPFFRLKGQFEAHPYNSDGEPLEVCTSGQAILPGVIEDQIVMALKQAQDSDANASILFAYDIQLVKANNPMGKEWVGRPLSEMADAGDPFVALRNNLKLAKPGIDAPKQIAAPAKPVKKK